MQIKIEPITRSDYDKLEINIRFFSRRVFFIHSSKDEFSLASARGKMNRLSYVLSAAFILSGINMFITKQILFAIDNLHDT